MKVMPIFVLAVLFLAGFAQTAPGQQVYRCESSDGSITFSDLPCRSDIGKRDTVDATPHQGHRPSPGPAEPAYTFEDDRDRAQGSRKARKRPASESERDGESLSRNERLSLERRRKRLLSALKRRHLEPGERRALVRDLREVDQALGIGPDDVPDMPFHNRDVYEAHPVHPGVSRG